MEHVAQIIVENSDLIFHNNSRDSFANGVEISNEGHTATMWIDDIDADVSITSADGDVSVSIGTYGTYGTGPYVVTQSPPSQQTTITSFEGIITFII